ncbi:MAG: HAMP domain-containing histidine kinase [Lysobacteraceae bacterium]|nr:MAG: HAMP domain-containing histidine kinase [Xanthomonadaceae bacterium]
MQDVLLDPVTAARDATTSPRDSAGLKNMQQLIQLRWFALAGQVATIAIVSLGLRIWLPLLPMGIVLLLLAAFNLLSLLHWGRRTDVTDGALLLSLLVDVVALTALLHLSGGVANPFVFLYLLQVVLGAVLLRARSSWVVVVATSLGVIGLILFPGPVVIPVDPARALADPYVQGLLLCFLLNATLLVVFITRISSILRARDARLADLRQRAAEEDHIVRMGLLASGAAHELGTPLATLSVILGDWRRMPPFTEQPELQQEIDEMQAQLARCKTIVSGILRSAGDARGEAPVETTVNDFLDEVVAEWRATRAVQEFEYRNSFGGNLPIISDWGLKQMIHNVLDNALEASPGWVGVYASRDRGHLVLRVRDAGPGFAPAMLAEFGKPYQSSKGRPGGGLGLFLSLNVARSLGGSLSALNREEGGAVVTMMLPLSSITHGETRDDDLA